MAGASTGTLTARESYQDFGESLDVYQVLGQGGFVQSGQTFAGFMYGNAMAQDNITAKSGGGQALAVQIIAPLARITTVAVAADSVVLPVSKRGMIVVITNDAAANAANVFPATGDAINALAVNAAFSLTVAAGPTIFYCFTAGTWRTK
jgi:hypothetical protein